MRSASCVPRLANTASDRGGNGTRKLRTGLAIGLAERLTQLRADVRCWNCGGAGRLFDGRGRGGIRARVHHIQRGKWPELVWRQGASPSARRRVRQA